MRRKFRKLLKTHIEKMSTFRLSMIFMKTNELSPSLQDVDEKKGTYSKAMRVAGYAGREAGGGRVQVAQVVGTVDDPVVLVAVRAFPIRDEWILLDHPDLEASLALPADSVNSPSGRYTVSAKRLGVPEKAWTHLAAAHREFSKMNFDVASREIESAWRADPACAQAFSMRAFIKLAVKDPQGAVADAKRAALLDPGDAESFIALAMASNALEEFQKAEAAVRHALSLHPDSWQGRLELAKSFYGQDELVLALCELDLANIAFPDAHLVRGNVPMRLGRKQEAAEAFSAFLREAPNDPRAEQIQRLGGTLPQPNRGANTAD